MRVRDERQWQSSSMIAPCPLGTQSTMTQFMKISSLNQNNKLFHFLHCRHCNNMNECGHQSISSSSNVPRSNGSLQSMWSKCVWYVVRLFLSTCLWVVCVAIVLEWFDCSVWSTAWALVDRKYMGEGQWNQIMNLTYKLYCILREIRWPSLVRYSSRSVL